MDPPLAIIYSISDRRCTNTHIVTLGKKADFVIDTDIEQILNCYWNIF